VSLPDPASGLRGAELRRCLERRVLPFVRTPAQYTGGELNQIVKDHDSVRARVALGFPDTYALGMSSLGLQILYHVWNERPEFSCERVFAPWPDMETRMREHGVPLYTLETFTPVREFDIFALSVPYELNFTNVLTLLDLAGQPLHSQERGEGRPLVIAGGHGAFSPEPLADFVDAFCIGEGEELALEVTDKVAELKPQGLPRDELLYRLCREVRGVYVPRFYRFEYGADGCIRDVTPLRRGLPFPVERRVVADLEQAAFPTRPIVPFVEAVHERCTIEIMRGCVNGCRFCQAGMVTRAQRERSPARVMALAQAGLAATGYDEIGLLSLSASDYTGIADLSRALNDRFGPQGVSLSLPSLRVGSVLATLPEEMSRTRKSGLTLAPEAATERLRRIINKPVRDEDLVEGCREAFRCGFTQVKLYFMLGLPGETDADLEAIGRLAQRIASLRREVCGRPAKVTASVSSFVPKPGTPFQFAPMCSRDEWRRRQGIVRGSARSSSVQFKFHDPEMSFLEGLFARGDRRLGAVLETAWRMGARFDGWSDQLKPDLWRAAFEKHGLDAEAYARRGRGVNEITPWVIVSDTVSAEFLRREWRRAFEEQLTPSCAGARDAPCAGCEACARSPLFEKKKALLSAPLDGREPDLEYARTHWNLPEGTAGAEGQL
jgi:radical SAM family uncharacterized protein